MKLQGENVKRPFLFPWTSGGLGNQGVFELLSSGPQQKGK